MAQLQTMPDFAQFDGITDSNLHECSWEYTIGREYADAMFGDVDDLDLLAFKGQRIDFLKNCIVCCGKSRRDRRWSRAVLPV